MTRLLAWLLVSVVHPHACGHGTERSQSPQVCKFWLSVLPLPHTLAEHSTCHMLHAMLLLVCAWPCVVRSCVLLRRYAVFSVGVSGAARHRDGHTLMRRRTHDPMRRRRRMQIKSRRRMQGEIYQCYQCYQSATGTYKVGTARTMRCSPWRGSLAWRLVRRT